MIWKIAKNIRLRSTHISWEQEEMYQEVPPYLLPFKGLLKETLTQPQFKDISIS